MAFNTHFVPGILFFFLTFLNVYLKILIYRGLFERVMDGWHADMLSPRRVIFLKCKETVHSSLRGFCCL